MNLLVDVGNTHIVSSITEGDDIIKSFRISTDTNLTEDQYIFFVYQFLTLNHIDLKSIETLILCSVVPTLDHIFKKAAKIIQSTFFSIADVENLFFSLPYTKEERGQDRVAAIAGALTSYTLSSAVVLDFGTASTIDVVINNTYIGGCIIPGVELNYNALSEKAALIRNIKPSFPKKSYGITLEDQVNGGILHGYIGQIRYILAEILTDFPETTVICTGGLSKMLFKHIEDLHIQDSNLVEKGMIYIHKAYCL